MEINFIRNIKKYLIILLNKCCYYKFLKEMIFFIFFLMCHSYFSKLNNSLPISLSLIDNIILSIFLSSFISILNLIYILIYSHNKCEFLVTFIISSFFLSLIFIISSIHFFFILNDYQNFINIKFNDNILKMSDILSLYKTKNNFLWTPSKNIKDLLPIYKSNVIFFNNNYFNINNFINLLNSKFDCDDIYSYDLYCLYNNNDNNDNNNSLSSLFKNDEENKLLFRLNLFEIFPKFYEIKFFKELYKNYYYMLFIILITLLISCFIIFNYIKILLCCNNNLIILKLINNKYKNNNNNIFIYYKYISYIYNYFNIISYFIVLLYCYFFTLHYNKYDILSYKNNKTNNYVSIVFSLILILFKNPYIFFIKIKKDDEEKKKEDDDEEEEEKMSSCNKKFNYLNIDIFYLYLNDTILFIYVLFNFFSFKKIDNNFFILKFKDKYGNIIDEKYEFKMLLNNINYIKTNYDLNFKTYKWNLIKYNEKKEEKILYTLIYNYIFDNLNNENYNNNYKYKENSQILNEKNICGFIIILLIFLILKNLIFIGIYLFGFINNFYNNDKNNKILYKNNNLLYGSFETFFLSITYIFICFLCINYIPEEPIYFCL